MSKLEQSIRVMKQIHEEIGIPVDYPPVKELSKRMSEYVKTNEPWSGSIKFPAYDRVAEVILPRKGDIRIRLRKMESKDK
jgi:hypothetical protein